MNYTRVLIIAIITFVCCTNLKAQNGKPIFWKPLPIPEDASLSVGELARDTSGRLVVGTGAGVYVSEDRGDSWHPRGPATWRVSAVLVTSSGTVLVGTYRDGVHRSTDLGQTWTPVGFERNVYVDTIIEDHAGRILTSVAESVGDEPTGIFHSDDDGKTWVQTGLPGEDAYSVSAPLPGHLYAGTENGMFRSTDGGETWSHVEALSFQAPLSMVVSLGDTLFAGFAEPRSRAHGHVVMRSSDRGKNWSPMDGLPAETSVRGLVASGDTLFAAAGDILRRGGTGLYRSSDLRRWEQVGFEDEGLRSLIATKTGALFASSGQGVFVSSPDRRKWCKKSKGLRGWSGQALAFDESGRLYAMKSSLFIYDEVKKTWTSYDLPDGTGPPTPYNLLRLPDGPFVLPGKGGIFLSDSPPGSWSWRPILGADGPILALYVAPNGRLFITFHPRGGGGTFMTHDNGKTWKRVAAPEGTRGVIVSPAGTLIAFGAEGIHRSTDEDTWDRVSRDRQAVSTMRVCGDALYAGKFTDGVFTSQDDGWTWEPITEKLRREAYQAGYLSVNSIFCLPNEGILVNTFSNGVLYWPPNGSWEDVSAGLATRMLSGGVLGPDGRVYVSTPRGVYTSTAWSKSAE